jgi:hypothetical protein
MGVSSKEKRQLPKKERVKKMRDFMKKTPYFNEGIKKITFHKIEGKKKKALR